MPAPVAATNGVLPTIEPFTVTTPAELTDTGTETGLDVLVPNTKDTVDVDEVSLAFNLAVSTDKVHGLTVTVLPAARGWSTG